ncbi:hypothetical protein Ahy_A08g038972 isoform B [Arachis hypogaea]|uniref:Uncharacterized protein n=1 Tax=Arachis hypogaea TaxID=3818 RepID=A0A445BUU5_ARAHY|nr:hypothetical protein Ahy_A08g038972 isoform B [Arachis hypogaea]
MYRRRGSRMGCLTAVVLCRRAAIDWSSSLSCCTVSKPLRRRSSLLHRRRSSPWSYPLSPASAVLLLKVIAVAVAIGVEIHAIFHLSCDFLRLLRASPQKYKPHLGSAETGLSFLNHSTV